MNTATSTRAQCAEYLRAALFRLGGIPDTSPELRRLFLEALHVKLDGDTVQLVATDDEVRAMLEAQERDSPEARRAAVELVTRVNDWTVTNLDALGADGELFTLDAITAEQDELRDELHDDHARLVSLLKPSRWARVISPRKNREKWEKHAAGALSWFDLTEGEQETLEAQTNNNFRASAAMKIANFSRLVDAFVNAAGFERDGAELYPLKRNGERLKCEPVAVDVDQLHAQFEEITAAFRVHWLNVLAAIYDTLDGETEGGEPVEEAGLGFPGVLRRVARRAREKEAARQRELKRERDEAEAKRRREAAEQNRAEHVRKMNELRVQLAEFESSPDELIREKKWAAFFSWCTVQAAFLGHEELSKQDEPGAFTSADEQWAKKRAAKTLRGALERRIQALKESEECDTKTTRAEVRLLSRMKFDAKNVKNLTEAMIEDEADNPPVIKSRAVPEVSSPSVDDGYEFG